MSNKYIDVLCKCPVHGSVNRETCCPTYGAVDSEMDKQIKSAGLGILIGSVALIALPLILIGSSNNSGSRMFDWFKAREQRRSEADKRSMQTLMQGRDRMSSSSKQQRDERMRRMFAAM